MIELKFKVKDGYKMTKLGVIPEDWEVKRIFECTKNIIDYRGRTPKKLGMEWGGGTIAALSANNVKMGKVDLTLPTYYGSPELYNKWMANGSLEKGDVLMTMEAPMGNIAQIPDNKKYILSQRVIGFKTKEFVYNTYLKYFLMSEIFQDLISRYSTGTTAKGISQKNLEKVSLIIPPLKEQKKIATILSSVDEHIEEIDGMIEDLKELKKGLMQKLLTGQYTLENGKLVKTKEFKKTKLGMIPKHWEVRKLENITEFIRDGTHGTHKDVENGIPLLSAKDISHGRILIPADCRKISEDDYKKIHKNYCIEEKDILLTIVGTVGRTAVVNQNSRKFTLQRSVAIVRPKNKSAADFLAYYFNSEAYKRQLRAETTASAQGGVYLKSLERTKVLIPSLKEQEKIALILSSVDERIETYQEQKEDIEELKKGLMQQLLTGKKRVRVN